MPSNIDNYLPIMLWLKTQTGQHWLGGILVAGQSTGKTGQVTDCEQWTCPSIHVHSTHSVFFHFEPVATSFPLCMHVLFSKEKKINNY